MERLSPAVGLCRFFTIIFLEKYYVLHIYKNVYGLKIFPLVCASYSILNEDKFKSRKNVWSKYKSILTSVCLQLAWEIWSILKEIELLK